MSESQAERELQAELDRVEDERRNAKGQLDRERLLRVTNDVVQTITSPRFVESMRQARREADEGAGLETAADLLSIDGLRGAGVDIPDDFRMTSRIFEDREQGVRFELRPIPTDPTIRPPEWGGCAGAGGLSFCGCGGFST